jgi:hypothetical protein
MYRGNRWQPLRFLPSVRSLAGARSVWGGAVLALSVLGAGAAHADVPAPEPWLFVEGECPSTERLRAEVLRLVPPDRRSVLDSARIVVRDLGDTYRVSVTSDVASAERRYDNPERECERRARFAAVFSVVTLLPPELGEEPEASPEPLASEPTAVSSPDPQGATEPPAQEELTHAEPPRDEWLELEAGFGVTLAPESPHSPKVSGTPLTAHVLVGADHWAGLVGAELLPPTSFQFLDVLGELSRASVLLGARHWVWRRPVGLGVELGAVGSFDRVQGEGLVSVADATTAFSLGVRGRVAVESPAAWQLRPYAAVHGTWYPAPPSLVVAPRGDVAELPAWWLGAELGIALGFD